MTLRLRLLDNELRCRLGGLSDITAPIEELARLNLAVERAISSKMCRRACALPMLAVLLSFSGSATL